MVHRRYCNGNGEGRALFRNGKCPEQPEGHGIRGSDKELIVKYHVLGGSTLLEGEQQGFV